MNKIANEKETKELKLRKIESNCRRIINLIEMVEAKKINQTDSLKNL